MRSVTQARASTVHLTDGLLEFTFESLFECLIRQCKDFRLSKLREIHHHPVQNNVSRGSNFDTETESCFTTSSTRSYKYGVSMSDSDVPGIDLSKYMVQ
jgi:hypothetical protein